HRLAQKTLAHPIGQPRTIALCGGGFERDRASELGVDRAIDGSHPAAPDHPPRLVAVALLGGPWEGPHAPPRRAPLGVAELRPCDLLRGPWEGPRVPPRRAPLGVVG